MITSTYQNYNNNIILPPYATTRWPGPFKTRLFKLGRRKEGRQARLRHRVQLGCAGVPGVPDPVCEAAVEAPGPHCCRSGRGLDLGARDVRQRVGLAQDIRSRSNDSIMPRIDPHARNSGQLRTGIDHMGPDTVRSTQVWPSMQTGKESGRGCHQSAARPKTRIAAAKKKPL